MVERRWTTVATASAGTLRLHERWVGSGPPVVQSQRACRAPDLPGFGHSDDPPAMLGVAGLADALADWLRTTGLTGAALLGNSAGCQFIVDCVVRHADITGPLVLVGPTTDPATRTAQQQVMRWLWTGMSSDVAQVPLLVADVRDAGPRRVAATFRSVLRHRMEDQLPHVAQPLLAVRGEHDHLVPQRWVDQVAWLAPHGRAAVVTGAAHVVNLTRPDRLAPLVRGFLASAEGTSP